MPHSGPPRHDHQDQQRAQGTQDKIALPDQELPYPFEHAQVRAQGRIDRVAQGRVGGMGQPPHVGRDHQRGHHQGQHEAPALMRSRPQSGQRGVHQHGRHRGHGLVLRQQAQAKTQTQQHPMPPPLALWSLLGMLCTPQGPGRTGRARQYHLIVAVCVQPAAVVGHAGDAGQGQRGSGDALDSGDEVPAKQQRQELERSAHQRRYPILQPKQRHPRRDQPGGQWRVLVVAPLQRTNPGHLLGTVHRNLAHCPQQEQRP
jgi:hypothetical protein